jgi:predicted nicotinamide N-methyase
MDGFLQLQTFYFGNKTVQLYVPNPLQVQQNFTQQLKVNPATISPYWSQVWPSAISLCEFLERHPEFIQHKKVLELAAGLGLPSLLAAAYAKEVHCSDYIQEAVDIAQQSISYNKLTNIHCSLLDWNHLPENLTADVLLLSDINYEQAAFEILFNVLQRFLNNGSTIILSTPQRIMAKPFIERLLPWCIHQEEIVVQENVLTAVLVLKKGIM